MACSKHASEKVRALPKIREGERVLTFHGPILREAECVQVAVQDQQVKYLVRYRSEGGMEMSGAFQGAGAFVSAPTSSLGGASSSGVGAGEGAGPSASARLSEHLSPIACWDYEWIPESRVLRYCSVSEKDSDSDSDSDSDGNGSATTSSGTSGQAADVGEGSSHGKGGGVVQLPLMRQGPGAPERRFLQRREVKVTLPDALKSLLVKDWELVTNGKKLFTLPAKKSVDAILAEYVASQQNCEALNKRYTVHELMAGIKEYFNVMLGTQLLYKFERPQYRELLASHPNVCMSQIYGGAHLLRLFVQLGSVLAYTALDDSSLSLLLGHLQDFLKYLACNPSVLFTAADYQVASAEYQQRAE
ncbi:mortality factor 4-like protein 1 [Dromiciops gliroides]|uniref:mortality factor 4-like protein 1 n=1 Tax=Dromiciops gliroides TaxID=33562 RepID=UPI001CC79DC1|nr:mortality factor 4-like protein 1 [Dromiciops gliroides]